MNRLLPLLFIWLLACVLSGRLNKTYAQSRPATHALSQEEIKDFIRQSEQLVRFMEFAFNTIGDSSTSAREKDIIINQSYLKFFASDKVQIEDDLLEGRFTVTNKEVQPYLKDIDFFFRYVTFEFQVEDISYNVNEQGKVFFVVTTNRILRGLGVEGDTVFNVQPRFIEINLDHDRRDLKIASIYTNKISEKEDMRNWWSALTPDWRHFFAKGVSLEELYTLDNIISFHDSWILVERFQASNLDNYYLETRRADTVFTNAGHMYQLISQIWKLESLDITSNTVIAGLSPLSKLTGLRTLNISGTQVDDLMPIRNLTRLENLNISNTAVSNLEFLRHAVNLKTLEASNIPLMDISTVSGFSSLERLDISNTKVLNLTPLASLNNLTDLRLNSTPVRDITLISNLANLLILDISSTFVSSFPTMEKLGSLERLHADNTSITDLSPLSVLNNLKYIFIEGTNISDLHSLSGLPQLSRVYCDRTLVTREIAMEFMQSNPEVLVIYETQALSAWWDGLPTAWHDVFRGTVEISSPPTREELHEVANIRTLNLEGNQSVISLSPLQQLLSLKYLNLAHSAIFSIEPLRDNIDLLELNLHNTRVSDISALSALRLLQHLVLSNTPIDDIEVLRYSRNLKVLDIENTSVNSIGPLNHLSNLELVYCDELGIDPEEVAPVYDANPNVTIIYQTEALITWWYSLPPEWEAIFRRYITMDSPPTRLQLQRLVDQQEIDISNTVMQSGLRSLEPFHRLRILRMNNTRISDLSPLRNLKNLRELYCSDNPISNLEPLKNLTRLEVLDFSNTMVSRLNDLKLMENLRVLNIAGTQVRNLRPISQLYNLRQLDCFNTRIRSIRPLENLKNLELLRCYNTNIWRSSIQRFMLAVPDCEVVYY